MANPQKKNTAKFAACWKIWHSHASRIVSRGLHRGLLTCHQTHHDDNEGASHIRDVTKTGGHLLHATVTNDLQRLSTRERSFETSFSQRRKHNTLSHIVPAFSPAKSRRSSNAHTPHNDQEITLTRTCYHMIVASER